MKLRKKAKKYQGFTKERELYKLMFTPLPKSDETKDGKEKQDAKEVKV